MIRKASAQWTGGLKSGKGKVAVESGAFDLPYSFGTRFGDERGTNPEELIGAAHAGCFTMALAAALKGAGKPATSLETSAAVTIVSQDGGFKITTIQLQTHGTVPNIDDAEFQRIANTAKETCPVSRALAGTSISLDARLDAA